MKARKTRIVVITDLPRSEVVEASMEWDVPWQWSFAHPRDIAQGPDLVFLCLVGPEAISDDDVADRLEAAAQHRVPMIAINLGHGCRSPVPLRSGRVTWCPSFSAGSICDALVRAEKSDSNQPSRRQTARLVTISTRKRHDR